MHKLIFYGIVTLCSMGFVSPSEPQPKPRVEPASFVAPEGKALVVFARPSKLGKAVNFYVLDGDKKLVTLFKGNEHVAITAPPGMHTFYVVSENAKAVKAELGAGRTYIIHAKAKMGMGKARVEVEPALRNSPSFEESAQWLRDTKAGTPDFDKGKKWVSKHQKAIDKRIDEAETVSMGVDDGRTKEEAAGL